MNYVILYRLSSVSFKSFRIRLLLSNEEYILGGYTYLLNFTFIRNINSIRRVASNLLIGNTKAANCKSSYNRYQKHLCAILLILTFGYRIPDIEYQKYLYIVLEILKFGY